MNISRIKEKLDIAREQLNGAEMLLSGKEEQDHPLLFKVADLETALRELHFGQAHEIATRVCKSLVPYDGAYTEKEVSQAFKDVYSYTDGSTMQKTFEQARRNRLSRSHKEENA